MSWWSMITTKGRLLQDFLVSFRDGELYISWVRLEQGEDIAILIDRLNNQARLYAPLGDCRVLASRHQYELVFPSPKEEETFFTPIERLQLVEVDGGASLKDAHLPLEIQQAVTSATKPA